MTAASLGAVDLLPCPFCGGKPDENAIEAHTHSPLLKSFGIPDHKGSHVIECGCGAGLIDETRAAVVAHWNTRAKVAALTPAAGVPFGYVSAIHAFDMQRDGQVSVTATPDGCHSVPVYLAAPAPPPADAVRALVGSDESALPGWRSGRATDPRRTCAESALSPTVQMPAAAPTPEGSDSVMARFMGGETVRAVSTDITGRITHAEPAPNWCRTCGKRPNDPAAAFCSDSIHKEQNAHDR